MSDDSLTHLKGTLLARQGNLAAELRTKRQTVVLIEADLVRARREADTMAGEVQATEQALADIGAALQPAGTAPAGPVQSPG